MDRKKKITPITNEDYQAVIDNSVQGAGSRLVGNAAEQKKLFVKPIANTDGSPNVMDYIKRLVTEIAEVIAEGDLAVDELAGVVDSATEELKTKLTKSTTPNRLYGTDAHGRYKMYELNEVGDIIGGEGEIGDIFQFVSELPEEGMKNVLYFVFKTDGEGDDLFDEWVWANKGTAEEPVYYWEYIGTKKISIDTSLFVKFTDIANDNKAGVVKVNQANSGMRVLDDGQLKLYPASPVAITFRPQSGVNYNETAPITLGNLNEAVIATFTDDKKMQMSEEQKAKACETIGAVKRNPNESAGFMRAYGMTSTGEETTYRIVNGTMASTIALRGVNGRTMVGNPEADADAIPKKYAEDNFVAKTEVSETYTANTIPKRTATGTINTNDPQWGNEAANKRYVDDNKGTKLYLHNITCDGVIVGGGSDGMNVSCSVFIVNALESVNSVFNALSVPVLHISITFEGGNVMVLDISYQESAIYLGFLDQDGVVYVRVDGALGVETTELSKFGE